VRFVVGEVAPLYVASTAAHSLLSAGAGTQGPLVVDVQSGLSLTPPTEG
jgi:hypothetical protein